MNPENQDELLKLKYKERELYVSENTSFIYISGSRLYGTNNQSSDIDKRGVFLHSHQNMFSITKEDSFEEFIFQNDDDKVLFELKRYASLLREQNPSIIEGLWVPDKHILLDSDLYKTLRDNRHEFITPMVYEKHMGYAQSQFKLSQKLEKKHYAKAVPEPKRDEFLTVFANISGKTFGKLGYPIDNTFAVRDKQHPGFFKIYSANSLENKEHSWLQGNNFSFVQQEPINIQPLVIVYFNSEAFKSAQLNYKNYIAWQQNGNQNKLSLSEELGYLPKPMMHAIRNLYMVKDLIEKQDLILERPEKDFLKDIREGKYSLSEVIDFYKTLEDYVKTKSSQISFTEFNEELLKEILIDSYSSKYQIPNNNNVNGKSRKP